MFLRFPTLVWNQILGQPPRGTLKVLTPTATSLRHGSIPAEDFSYLLTVLGISSHWKVGPILFHQFQFLDWLIPHQFRFKRLGEKKKGHLIILTLLFCRASCFTTLYFVFLKLIVVNVNQTSQSFQFRVQSTCDPILPSTTYHFIFILT